MYHQKIEIQTEHSKIIDEVQKLNKQVQHLTAIRIYPECAFYGLQKMLKEDTDEPVNDEIIIANTDK